MENSLNTSTRTPTTIALVDQGGIRPTFGCVLMLGKVMIFSVAELKVVLGPTFFT